jgi:hypothetical protein
MTLIGAYASNWECPACVCWKPEQPSHQQRKDPIALRKKSPKRATACQQALNGIFRSANRVADGTVRINRLGRSILPQCSWLIYRDVVPDDRRAVPFSEQVRQCSTPIPILHRSYIRNAREGSGRRRSKIRGQHRLPDRKNPYVLVIEFL